jgi:hypothetical protein
MGQVNIRKVVIPNTPNDGHTGIWIDEDDVPFLVLSDGSIVPFAASELSTEILQALNGATSPSSSNVFLTFADISNVLGQNSYLVYGGNVQYSGTGLIFSGSPSGVVINNNFLEFASDTITLDAADVTNDRRDRFIINESGWDKLTGTPSVTPIAPVANNITEVGLGDVLIEANALVPSDITDEDVYKENTEWTGSKTGTGTVAFNSTVDPFAGTVSVESTSIQNGLRIIFTASGDLDKNDYESIGLQIRLKATMNNGRNLAVFFRNAASEAISTTQNLPITKGNSTTYQFTGIDFDNFTWSSNLVRQVVFEYVGSGGPATYTGFFMDNIIIQGGIEQPFEPADISFLQLTDAPSPSTYVGNGGKIVKVRIDELGLEFDDESAGSGTVTSVAIAGTDGLQVDSGSPITTAGTITLGVDASALRTHINVADGATANTGTVTSVAVTGTDGIEVDSGSPITGAGNITLGLNATTIKDTAFPEAELRESNEVIFGKNYIIGNAGFRTGNITFDFTGAKLGATTVMRHKDAGAFTIPSNAELLAGEYDGTVDNYLWFVLRDKTASTEKVQYTISQVQP